MEINNEEQRTESNAESLSLPQKKYYRQRAHSNPIADHCFNYPTTPDEIDWKSLYPLYDENHQIEFLDIGCGYGGLLVDLSQLFPETLILGIEIRHKVSKYVCNRIEILRKTTPGQYKNISCIRSNAMKYLPNFFRKSQLSKIFFIFPDPHFKKHKHKWRIISPQLLTEYAYFLRIDGHAYFASDVKDLYEWMLKHFSSHPLFVQVPDEEVQKDPIVSKFAYTEEGSKVCRNGGNIYIAVFRRIPDPYLTNN